MNKPKFVSHTERYGPAPDKAAEAMRRNDMMIGLVCRNMLAGRDGFAGLGQFLDGPVVRGGEDG